MIQLSSAKALNLVLAHYGEKEKAGSRSNSKILSWIRSSFKWVQDDGEMPWCSLLLMNVLNKDFNITGATPMARSWLEVGKQVMWNEAVPGDVIVITRGPKDGTSGHVGLFIRYDHSRKTVWILGGNQRDALNIMEFNSSDILGLRRLQLN